MQTTLPAQAPLAERSFQERTFQVSTHIRPASLGAMPRSTRMHTMQRPSSGASSPQVGVLPRDVSSRFGARLRELRRERNLTQLRMANDFGIDRSFISDVERGRKSISLPMLEVIALGMKLTLSDLLQDI